MIADVSRETRDRLTIYADLLKKWNPRINLVAPSTLPDLWSRHFEDSAQLVEMAPALHSWVDLGSGGGFPGAVVAILLRERAPSAAVTLVESDQRKATFLRTVSRETGAGFTVVADRVESVPPFDADVLSARALAPLPQLLAFAERHLARGGTALFPKGRTASSEIEAALEHWRFACETLPSKTDADSVILRIKDVERA